MLNLPITTIYVICALLVFGAAIILAIAILHVKSQSKGSNSYSPRQWKNSIDITGTVYTRNRLMNSDEIRYFYALKNLIEGNFDRKFLLFTQVSMGSFLGHSNRDYFNAINSKRVDFLITDTKGNPLLVLEYQGHGHHGRTEYQRSKVEERDDVKRAVFYSCQLMLIEIAAGEKIENVINKVASILDFYVARSEAIRKAA